MIEYTEAELKNRKYNLNFILQQARAVVMDRTRDRLKGVCMNAVPQEARGKNGVLYNLKEASDMIEQIIDDTFFYS
jgi:hypothetical protein